MKNIGEYLNSRLLSECCRQSQRGVNPYGRAPRIRLMPCSTRFQFRRPSDTWAASGVFAMRLTIISAWSRMRTRDEQA
jgi:hypothetical protein